MPDIITRKARAKINLALHVTGQRDDGYHLLDSLVVFAEYGDSVSVSTAPNRETGDHKLAISGPFSSGLELDHDNLVLKAARLMGSTLPALDIHLVKNLPVASGIGGGSADAAATLSAISALLGISPLEPEDTLVLGADVPVCVVGKTVRMGGIGEEISFCPSVPTVHMVLVNPGVSVSTPTIFKALTNKNASPLQPFPQNGWDDAKALTTWLETNRNDLQAPAISISPVIQTCLDAIDSLDNVLMRRMSGSGATCFALFETRQSVEEAVEKLRRDNPDWWVIATQIAAN